MTWASLGRTPKNPASKQSAPLRTPRARTYGPRRMSSAASSPDSASSASLKNEIPSLPSTRFAHSSSTLSAPGNRPAIPMIAMPSYSSSLIQLSPCPQTQLGQRLLLEQHAGTQLVTVQGSRATLAEVEGKGAYRWMLKERDDGKFGPQHVAQHAVDLYDTEGETAKIAEMF